MSINIEDLLKQANDGYDDAAKPNTFQADPRILVLKKNVTYKGRFVINGKDPSRSRVPYNEFMFTSRLDGKTLAYGGRDPNDLKEVKEDIWTKTKWDEYAKAKESGTEKAADAPYKLLNPKRKELVNFYLHEVVGDDPEAVAKVGQVVVLKFPAQMNYDKKSGKNVYRSDILIRIEEGLTGDDKEEVGPKRAWSLGKDGRSFIVKVTEKDRYPNYSGSKWADAKDLGLTEKQQKEIMFEKAHNLLEFVPKTLTQEELKALLDKHYFCNSANTEDDVDTDTDADGSDDDIIPGLGKKFDVDDDLSLDGI